MSADPAAAQVVGAGTLLRFLPLAIRVPQRPLVAITVGWLLAFPLSVLLSAIAAFFLPDAASPTFEFSGAAAILALVVFAPIVETLIMGAALMLLQLLLSPVAAILVSAAGWAVAHSLAAPGWGLVIWWPFLIFSTLFVTWQSRSFAHAFGIAACAHALQNLIPAIVVAQGAVG